MVVTPAIRNQLLLSQLIFNYDKTSNTESNNLDRNEKLPVTTSPPCTRSLNIPAVSIGISTTKKSI